MNLGRFTEEYKGKRLSIIIPPFIAMLEDLELVSTAPKIDTFNTPKERMRTHRTPAVAGVVKVTGPPNVVVARPVDMGMFPQCL